MSVFKKWECHMSSHRPTNCFHVKKQKCKYCKLLVYIHTYTYYKCIHNMCVCIGIMTWCDIGSNGWGHVSVIWPKYLSVRRDIVQEKSAGACGVAQQVKPLPATLPSLKSAGSSPSCPATQPAPYQCPWEGSGLPPTWETRMEGTSGWKSSLSLYHCLSNKKSARTANISVSSHLETPSTSRIHQRSPQG